MHRLGIWRRGMLSMSHRGPGPSVTGARRPGGCTTALEVFRSCIDGNAASAAARKLRQPALSS